VQVEWQAQLADAQGSLMSGEIGSLGLSGTLEGRPSVAMLLSNGPAGRILSQYSLHKIGTYQVETFITMSTPASIGDVQSNLVKRNVKMTAKQSRLEQNPC
jgi:hypothetical protein